MPVGGLDVDLGTRFFCASSRPGSKKGRQERIVHLHQKAAATIARYSLSVRPRGHGIFFVGL